MASNARAHRGPGRPSRADAPDSRASLVSAAREIMAARGLAGVSARAVAERADLNPGLVRYYFGGKDGLLRAVVEQVTEEAVARSAALREAAGSPRERLRGEIEAMVQSFAEDPHAARLLFEQVVFADDEIVERFVARFADAHVASLRALIEEGQASGDFRDLDPDLLIPAIAGASIFLFLASPVLSRVGDRRELTPERVAQFRQTVADMVLRGIDRSG